MIAVGSYLLVYSLSRDARLDSHAHRIATRLDEGLGDRLWAIPFWLYCFECLSVASNRRLENDGAATLSQAWCQFQPRTEPPSNRLIGEIEDFSAVLERFVDRPHGVGSVAHNARIAAICFAHGVEALLPRDRDFSLFPELPTRGPFEPAKRRKSRVAALQSQLTQSKLVSGGKVPTPS